MCIRKYVHHLACDSRPLFTTTLDESRYEVFVDPYSPPERCGHGICFADPDLPELPRHEQCQYHPCCWIATSDIRCPALAARVRVPGRVGTMPWEDTVDECTHLEDFHVYVQDERRTMVPAPVWAKAMYPDSHLVERDPAPEEVPQPRYEFVLARGNLLRAGQRLFAAKQTLFAARKEWMKLLETRSCGEYVSPRTVEAVEQRYQMALAAGKSCQETFYDCANILTCLEGQGAGCLHLLALRWKTGLNVELGGDWAEVMYDRWGGYFVGTYVCQRPDCENPASICREFPFAIDYGAERNVYDLYLS